VLVETELVTTELGKILMAATFVTDFGPHLPCPSCSRSPAHISRSSSSRPSLPNDYTHAA
jgi:hypothetical protein